MIVDEPQCLIVQPNEPKCDVMLYSVPARLITPEVRKAFEEGAEISSIEYAEEDPDDKDFALEECLEPLVGKITFLGVGKPGMFLKHKRFQQVLVTRPFSLF